MDINQILEQAKQRGLSALDSIKKSLTPEVKTQYQSRNVTPQTTPFRTFETPYTPFKPTVTTPLSTIKSLKPLQISPTISNITLAPKLEQKPFNVAESLQSMPKISEVIFGDIAKQGNRNLEYNWNRLSSELGDFLTTKVAPVLLESIQTGAKYGITPTTGGGIGGPLDGSRDLQLFLKPEAAAEVRLKEAEANLQVGLGALQTAGLPFDVLKRSLIQPIFDNELLDRRQAATGIPATAAERAAAATGNLNLSENTLYNRSLVSITNQMTPEEKIKAETNNWNYYTSEATDIAKLLIDVDTILGGAGIVRSLGETGVKKLTTKVAKEAAKEIKEKAVRYTPNDLLNAVGEGNKPKIQEIIKRPLTAAEDLKIDELNEIALSDAFSKELKDLRTQTFFGKTKEEVSDLTTKFNTYWENRKIDKINQEKLTEYDKLVSGLRETAAGTRSIKEKFGDAWLGLRRGYWNKRSFSFELLDRIAKESGNLTRQQNPKYFADALEKTSEQAETFLNTQGFYRALETAVKEGKGIIKKGEDIVDNFGNFLEARRKLTLSDLGIQKLDEGAYELYRGIFLERKDRYVEAAKQFDEFMNNLVDRASSILTPEEIKRYKETGDYAPFYRIFNEFTSAPVNKLSKSKTDLAQQTSFRKLGFNDGIIKNPLEAAELMTYSVIDQLNRNTYASKWGDLIKEGKVPGAFIVRDAKNVIRQEQIKDSLVEVEKAKTKLQKIVGRGKNAAKEVVQELNSLNKQGINLSLKANTPEENSKFFDRVTKVIERKLDKRDQIIQDSEDLFQDILKIKQEGKVVLSNEKFINRTNRMIDTREEWLADLLEVGAINLSNKGQKFMKDFKGKFPNVKFRKEYIKQLSKEDVLDFIYEFYDLPTDKLNNLIKTATKNKLKIDSVLKEIDNIKKNQVTNTLTNSLVTMPDQQLEKLIEKSGKKEGALGDILREIKKASDDRLYNSLANSLITQGVDGLDRIKNKITKKEAILGEMVDDLLTQQQKLDVESGYAKSLKEESEIIDELDRNGQPFISWLKDGVTEIAVVDKNLAEEFFTADTKLENKIGRTLLDFFIIGPTKFWKAGTTTFIPDSRYRQLVKDTETIGFFFDGEVRDSILNPVNFVKAISDVTKKTPEYNKWIELGGGGSFYKSIGSSQELKEFAKKSAKKINYKNVGAKSLDKLDALAGADEVARRFQIFKAVEKNLIKNGMDPQEAALEGVWQSNNVLPNYFQTGTVNNALELALTYSKIKMQSGKVMLNMFRTNPVKATGRVIGKIAIPTALWTSWNMLDGDRAKVYEDVPDSVKDKNIIIVPLNPINPDGSYKEVYKIPAEETLMGFSNPFRRGIENAIRNGDENDLTAFARQFFSAESLSDVVESTTGITIPTEKKQAIKEIGSSINPIFRGFIEGATNWDFFREKNIVTDEVKNRSAINQWDDKTSLLAKEVGLKTNQSPMVVDWFIRTYFQGINKYAQQPLENAIKQAKNDPDAVVTGKNPVDTLVETLTFKTEVKPGAKAVKETYEILNKKTQEDADRNFLIKNAMAEGDVDKLKSMAPMLTEAQFNQLYTSMQKQAAQSILPAEQKVLFNATESELQRILKEKPELQAAVNNVKELKIETSKLPKLNTTGFQFMPSESKGGGGGGVKFKPSKAPSFKGTGRKVTVSKVSLKAPKKPKAFKVKKLKAVKFAKIKPLKKVKRL